MSSQIVKSAVKAKSLAKVEKKLWDVDVLQPGIGQPRIAVAKFDPSGDATKRPVASYDLGVAIPAGALVVGFWYEVITTFTSAGANAGTIALTVESAGDLKAAMAISDASNPYNAGRVKVSITAPVLTTQDRELTATVAGQALTAGKLVLYVEYVLRAQ